MKIFLLCVLVATSFGAINVVCLKELTKLGIDLAKTAVAFGTGNTSAAFMNLIKDFQRVALEINLN